MPVLAAMGKSKSRRIGETVGSAMHHFGHHGQSQNGASAKARREQQLGEIFRTAFGRRPERAVQPSRHHVLCTNLMVAGIARCGSSPATPHLAPFASEENSRKMRSGPSDVIKSSCPCRELFARRSVRFTISPAPRLR